jgi:Protein of unknown function with HXXEE motif
MPGAREDPEPERGMDDTPPAGREDAGPAWAWLFPLTYAVHIAEEYWGGFPRWFSHTFDARLTVPEFVSINLVGWVMIAVAAGLIHGGGAAFRGLVPLLATIVLGNRLSHVVLSATTRSYSPGAISGGLLWVPLGGLSLAWAWRRTSRAGFAAGAVAGLLVLLGVFLQARGR